MNRSKIIAIALSVFTIAGVFSSCGEKKVSTDGGASVESESAQSKVSELKIEDIDWKVEEGIVDGDRALVLNYTNNSSNTIKFLSIDFVQKSDITDEDKEQFLSELKSLHDFSDEDISEIADKPIKIHVETFYDVIAPGKSLLNTICTYYDGYEYVTNASHYDLVEPDLATIEYVSDGLIYTEYYDFKSNKYSMADQTTIAYEWATTELGNLIPKPEVDILESTRDDDKCFMFTAYGMDRDMFDKYYEDCKSIGFTENENKINDDTLYIYDSVGNQLQLWFADNSLRVTLKIKESLE